METFSCPECQSEFIVPEDKLKDLKTSSYKTQCAHCQQLLALLWNPTDGEPLVVLWDWP